VFVKQKKEKRSANHYSSEGFEESPEFYNVCVKRRDTLLCPLLCVFLEEGGRGVSQ
jgi:hypothetical protein